MRIVRAMIVHILVPVIVVCSTIAAAGAATKHVSKGDIKPPAATIRVMDSGTAFLTGAFIETNYVTRDDVPTAKAQALGRREAAHGRDAFNEAILYLKESPRARSLIDRIERTDSMISVSINHECKNDQKMTISGNSVILWDPNCAYRVGRSSNSPSVVLMHELVHTLHLSEDPQAYLDGSSKKDRRFDTAEERRTILYGEVPVARELGEAVRRDHHENKPFRVSDPTLR